MRYCFHIFRTFGIVLANFLQVMEILVREKDIESGTSIDAMCRQLAGRFTAVEVRYFSYHSAVFIATFAYQIACDFSKTVESLCAEAHIYSTADEEHYRATAPA